MKSEREIKEDLEYFVDRCFKALSKLSKYGITAHDRSRVCALIEIIKSTDEELLQEISEDLIE